MTDRKPGFYWIVSERSSIRGVAQWHNGVWWCIGEAGPVNKAEMERRGWKPGEFIGADTVDRLMRF